ncbi:MAG: hypothetical protein R2735_06280 [Microthrixaceae bacterium]
MAAPAIRERFGWTESHLATLHDWIEDTNVRWGLDPEHRSHFGFPSELRSFTWQSALDQLLLGTAIRATDEFCIGDTLAVDSASSDPSLVGELAGVLSVLADLSAQVESARTVADWAVVLADVVHNLLAPDPDAEWQLESTIRELRVSSTPHDCHDLMGSSTTPVDQRPPQRWSSSPNCVRCSTMLSARPRAAPTSSEVASPSPH